MGSSSSNSRRAGRTNMQAGNGAPRGAVTRTVVQQPRHSAPPSQQQQPMSRGPGQVPPHLLNHQAPNFQMMYSGPPPPAQVQGPPGSGMAEVKEAQTIVNPCTVHRRSVALLDGSVLKFVITTTVPKCQYEVHIATREYVRKGVVIFTPNKPKAPPPTITIEQPKDELELQVPLDLTEVSNQEQEYVKQYPKQIPVSIVLKYTNAQGLEFIEYTYVQIKPKPKVVKQLLSHGGMLYLMEGLFGGGDDEASQPTVAAVADGGTPSGPSSLSPTTAEVAMELSEEKECVICLTEEIDTAVIPCRHMCLCRRCAEELRRHSPKCPVCRGPIEQLLTKHKVGTPTA